MTETDWVDYEVSTPEWEVELVLISEASLIPRSLVVELDAVISNPVRTANIVTVPEVETGSRKLLDQV